MSDARTLGATGWRARPLDLTLLDPLHRELPLGVPSVSRTAVEGDGPASATQPPRRYAKMREQTKMQCEVVMKEMFR